jgi:hypothetical protein
MEKEKYKQCKDDQKAVDSQILPNFKAIPQLQGDMWSGLSLP